MRSAYDRIYFDLKRDIDTEVFRFKEYLPSEAELCKRYGCAHNTVRRAIAALAGIGYVQAIHGRGVRVILQSTPFDKDNHARYNPTLMESFCETGKRLGLPVSTKVNLMETIIVDRDFSSQTGFDLGNKVVHFERVHFFDGIPCEREMNYFRGDIVEGITIADAEASIYEYIESVRKGKLVTSKRFMTLEHADALDQELLEVDEASHIAEVVVQTFDGEGLLCEVSRVHWRPEVFSACDIAIRTQLNQSL